MPLIETYVTHRQRRLMSAKNRKLAKRQAETDRRFFKNANSSTHRYDSTLQSKVNSNLVRNVFLTQEQRQGNTFDKQSIIRDESKVKGR